MTGIIRDKKRLGDDGEWIVETEYVIDGRVVSLKEWRKAFPEKEGVPSFGNSRFHGVTTVAELKPNGRTGSASGRPGFPRRHNRGRIEASRRRRLLRRSLRFHGVTTVAELKLEPCNRLLAVLYVSTASQPWPN